MTLGRKHAVRDIEVRFSSVGLEGEVYALFATRVPNKDASQPR